MLRFLTVFVTLIFSFFFTYAQSGLLKGRVLNDKGEPVEFASVIHEASQKGTMTDKDGNFTIELPIGNDQVVWVKFLGYKDKKLYVNITSETTGIPEVRLETEARVMTQVEVNAQRDSRTEAGLTTIDPKNAILLPSAFGDFNKILQSLPGVISNNELTSTYSVRGGNYDENLIYVNGIEVYRPFLISSGQQEGLSFVNPNLASSVDFSSGGWRAKYGDRLSSVMNVNYKEPKKFEGSFTGGLLGGSLHLGGSDKHNRVSIIGGFRNKTSTYLLNTLPTQGQYLPSFNDLQTYINFDLTNRSKEFPVAKRTTLGVLASYANNRYFVDPDKSETNFGTATSTLKLSMGFDGTELMQYDTWQGGVKLSHWVNPNFKTDFFISGMDSREREYVDLEAGYRLCEVVPDPQGAKDFNKCAVERGIGAQYKYARNSLHAQVYALENRSYLYLTRKTTFEFGAKYSKEIFNDRLYEYSFRDSLGYVKLDPSLITDIELNTNRFSGYLQMSHAIDTFQTLSYGVRIGFWDLNKQILISPSIQYSFKPHWEKNFVFRAATGIYRQPPFYRELRNFQGVINPNLRSQNAFHGLIGYDFRFKSWGREFKLTNEFYGKYLWDVIPYDIDNVRLRYYAQNNAIAYVAGIDTRVSGEFIKGSESWFSLSIMQTKEKVDGSPLGWIRRPTDQRVTFACFFQDHIPGNPSWKMFLNLVFGTGLPFGQPNNELSRGQLSIPPYRRVDIGFSKVLTFNRKEAGTRHFFESIMLGVEILNILGVNNTLSYIWVADFNNVNYAVPQTLSQRFLNGKIIAQF